EKKKARRFRPTRLFLFRPLRCGTLPAMVKRLALWVFATTPLLCQAANGDWSTTVYAAAISSQPGWEDIIIDAPDTRFVDSYLVTLALSRQYAERKDGALTFEAEGQIVK